MCYRYRVRYLGWAGLRGTHGQRLMRRHWAGPGYRYGYCYRYHGLSSALRHPRPKADETALGLAGPSLSLLLSLSWAGLGGTHGQRLSSSENMCFCLRCRDDLEQYSNPYL